jgi:serine/threonine-protein kinase
MSFYEGEDRLTKNGQEIGNRFLRLPEFSASSKWKRDTRSDVTLTAGILLYLLTGQSPRDLRDYNGQAPHQTPDARELLARHTDVDLLALLDIFDRAFDPIIDARWDSAEALSATLKAIKLGDVQMPADEPRDVMTKKLKEVMARHDELRLQKRHAQLHEAFATVQRGINALAGEIGGLVSVQGGYTIDAQAGKSTSELGLVKASDSTGYRPRFSVELRGSDIVLSFDDVPFYRGPSEEFDSDAVRVISQAQEVFLRGLRSRIAG